MLRAWCWLHSPGFLLLLKLLVLHAATAFLLGCCAEGTHRVLLHTLAQRLKRRANTACHHIPPIGTGLPRIDCWRCRVKTGEILRVTRQRAADAGVALLRGLPIGIERRTGGAHPPLEVPSLRVEARADIAARF